MEIDVCVFFQENSHGGSNEQAVLNWWLIIYKDKTTLFIICKQVYILQLDICTLHRIHLALTTQPLSTVVLENNGLILSSTVTPHSPTLSLGNKGGGRGVGYTMHYLQKGKMGDSSKW